MPTQRWRIFARSIALLVIIPGDLMLAFVMFMLTFHPDRNYGYAVAYGVVALLAIAFGTALGRCVDDGSRRFYLAQWIVVAVGIVFLGALWAAAMWVAPAP